ncbi:very-long-chain (3R)-3-hydroxyacyl-CoA dehydratase PASTICCINO 2A-like [Panicum virgatum]|uniref:very-long-chain (3R)-3-hydroxyacyl-CoA dehydratase PASTICCINO 2A-like n=1 Tax=Panicum virgatum TaxID=38727 RepID=UPI0019D58373|nr:very-long-chain (3R)-3-hydroxyacyl-CoA dehydratase PASTICCINO 2A-like [Panicum virgatum]
MYVEHSYEKRGPLPQWQSSCKHLFCPCYPEDGYDLANIDSKSLLLSMKKLQQPDGSQFRTPVTVTLGVFFLSAAPGVLFLSAAPEMAGVGSAVRRIYLAVYNWIVFAGWAQVLYYTILALWESGHEDVYGAVERPLQFAQTAAIMEILHGLVGLVRSPVSATLPQIGSRLFLTWGILWSFPETRSNILVTSLVISWSITEIIRYSFFGMKEIFGFAPSWLLWLRYSTFMVLYPTGISSEVGLIFAALPHMMASQRYCLRLPNKWNFSYDYSYTSILALAVYIPGSPHMFKYMLSQCKKALSKSKTV